MTGSPSHTAAHGKRARLDLGDSASGERPLDYLAPEDDLTHGTGPTQDVNLVSDHLDQESQGSPRLGTTDAVGDTEDPASGSSSQQHDQVFNATLSSEPPGQPLENEDTQQGDESAYTGPDAHPDDHPGGPNDWCPDDLVPHLDALRVSMEFIRGLRRASLDNDLIPADVRDRLRSPIAESPSIDKHLRLSIDGFLLSINGSHATYDKFCAAVRRFSPDAEPLSYDRLKRTVTELTGVVSVMTDMCFESCVAFSGPFSELRACPECSTPRYETVRRGNKLVTVPRKQALTIPVGPQIQAQYRSPEGAWNMAHRRRAMGTLLARLRDGGSIDVYDDVYCSSILLEAAKRGTLMPDDVVLMLSIDGAQLYQSKQSDCWIYIWVLLDLAPDLRYKKKYVLPGGFIPGPNKPKNLDSFVYTGLHHLSALQRDGLRIWDCQTGRVFTSRLFFFLGTADGPGLAALHGQVGHHGAFGCREYCGLKGRHKPGGPHYYPALMKPLDYELPGCNHGDVDIYRLPRASSELYMDNLNRLLRCESETQFKQVRKETGLCKPSLFLGLDHHHSSGLPGCLAIDHMHIIQPLVSGGLCN
jgi:hypothetical protein